jgi:hypothetical protein
MTNRVLLDDNIFKQWTFDDDAELIRPIQENAARLVLDEIKAHVAESPPIICGGENGPVIFVDYLPCTDTEEAFRATYDLESIWIDLDNQEKPHLIALKRILTEALEKVDVALNCHGVSAGLLLSPAQD